MVPWYWVPIAALIGSILAVLVIALVSANER